jgi:NTP pyrophosphatase (non-canonical NTP hydrolase)
MIMENQRMENIYEEALATWGPKPQIAMVAEEASELATAALHVLRDRDAINELAEEAADVEIMLAQLRVLIGEQIDEQKTRKLARLRKTLNKVNHVFLDSEDDVKRMAG